MTDVTATNTTFFARCFSHWRALFFTPGRRGTGSAATPASFNAKMHMRYRADGNRTAARRHCPAAPPRVLAPIIARNKRELSIETANIRVGVRDSLGGIKQ